jgi:type IV pilus assembly protein PilV
MRRQWKTARRREQGTTLVEALVALLVLSIGLLGVAGLQMMALRYNHSAHMRSQATALAYDISDRMRANRAAALAAAYNVVIGAVPAGTAVSDRDVIAWKTLLLNTLPSGDGGIALGANNRVTITVQWNDQRDALGGATMQFVTQTQL